MQKEVRFGGLATNPSDYDAADGQLSASQGLVNEDNALRPIWQPEVVGTSLGDRRVLFLHATSKYRHYIVVESIEGGENERLMWIAEEYLKGDYSEQEVIDHLVTIKDDIGTVVTVNAVGNTLIVITNTGMHYIRWKNSEYKYLGQQPPEMEIQFGVTGTHAANYPGLFKAGAGRGVGYAAHCTPTTDDMTDAVWAMISTTNKIITDAGHFYAPFVIRYCYRLFDGSMVMHSAPVFMPITAPNTYCVEDLRGWVDTNGVVHNINAGGYIEIGESGRYDLGTRYAYRYQPNNVSLVYKATCSEIETIKNEWSDIVKSVDVFVTPPIIREKTDVFPMGYTIKAPVYNYYLDKLDVRQLKLDINPFTTDLDSEHIWDVTRFCVRDFQMLTEAEYLEKIKTANTFYKISSFDLSRDELLVDGGWHDVPIGTGVLSSLATQEAMVDDYRTHNILMPHYNDEGVSYASLFSYNNRLNVSGVDDKLFKGFDLRTMIPYDSRVDNPGHGTVLPIKKAVVYIQTEDGEKIVERDMDTMVWKAALMNQPLFYPDRRAKKLLLKIRTALNVYTWYGFDMTESPMLNGAYTMGGIYEDISTEQGHNPLPNPVPAPTTPTKGSDIENTVNKIYTSEVDNPFYFPALTINSVGTGEIMATTTTTKALSQGQFGQFPLYAFCSDGVWALEVDSEGKYTAMHPVTRDVCTNINSITQIDNAVLFVTDRGIMLLQGSETTCLTDGIIGEEAFDPATLPHLSHFRDMDGNKMAMTHDFLAGCRMVYDYQHQHIIVYHPDKPFAFVLSMKSKLWGMMESDLATTLNSYPEALAINKQGRLVSFAGTTQEDVQGLVVTRPLKLGAPDIYKTIHTMKQNGMFAKGHVQTLLYGSRDQHKWYLIASSVDEWIRGLRGTPWRWFRIALLTDLRKGESVSSATVAFETKETDKLH